MTSLGALLVLFSAGSVSVVLQGCGSGGQEEQSLNETTHVQNGTAAENITTAADENLKAVSTTAVPNKIATTAAEDAKTTKEAAHVVEESKVQTTEKVDKVKAEKVMSEGEKAKAKMTIAATSTNSTSKTEQGESSSADKTTPVTDNATVNTENATSADEESKARITENETPADEEAKANMTENETSAAGKAKRTENATSEDDIKTTANVTSVPKEVKTGKNETEENSKPKSVESATSVAKEAETSETPEEATTALDSLLDGLKGAIQVDCGDVCDAVGGSYRGMGMRGGGEIRVYSCKCGRAGDIQVQCTSSPFEECCQGRCGKSDPAPQASGDLNETTGLDLAWRSQGSMLASPQKLLHASVLLLAGMLVATLAIVGGRRLFRARQFAAVDASEGLRHDLEEDPAIMALEGFIADEEME